MIDYGARKTDLAVKRTEWRLSRVYRQAERDIAEKMETWQKRHAAREKLYRQQLKDGKITQADFDAWMRGQVFQGKQWQARKEQIQAVLLNADKSAAKIVNDGKLGVFVDNANYIGYGLEHDANINTGFMLYDEQTVARLIKSDPQILPKPAPGVKKDKAYVYYNKLVNGAITQGIVQGEDIRQIAKRIARETGERSYNSAVRNARTAYTGAQNAGRIEGLHQAQRLSINVKKKWLATLDGRTRDSHRKLDGQIQEVDDPFISELGKIRFPGDPTANGGDVYNCRCTLTYVYPEYPSEMQRRDNETGEIVGDMTYEEWEKWKATGEMPKPQKPINPELSFAEKISQMRHENGEYTHEELRAAGKVVYDEYAKREAETLLPLQTRYDSISDEMTKLREEGYTDIFNDSRRMSPSKFREKYGQDFADMDIAKRMKDLRTEKTDLWLKIDNYRNGDLLASVLKEVRPLADELGEKWMFDHIANSRKNDTVKEFFAALKNYPKKWVELAYTAEQPRLFKTAGRAYNAGYEICTDGDRGTTYHELGHQFEHMINRKDEIGILTEEGKFYKRRTEGLELKWLGSGYARNEKTRRDDFIHPYMGKDYGGGAYELVSMGFEYAYTDPNQLAKDPDMQEWIYGLLALK